MSHAMADEEIEHTARALADDISFVLDERGIEHETHLDWNGCDGDDEGWYVVVTAGHEVHGSPLREYTATYVTAERRWLYQSVTEDGEQEGPHGLTELTGESSPVEAAEHVAANVSRGAR